MKTPRYTKDQIATALTRTKGMITLAAQSLGCDPTTVRNYLARYPELQTVLSDERERMTDMTELKLYEAIQNREGWAITLYLKTQGKSRGYVERQELTGANGGPIATTTQPDYSKLSTDELKTLRDLLSKSA
jgi:hypothetical protein